MLMSTRTTYLITAGSASLAPALLILILGVPLATALLGLLFFVPIIGPAWFPEHSAKVAHKFEAQPVTHRFVILAVGCTAFCGLMAASTVVMMGIMLLGCLIYASTCDSTGWRTYHSLRSSTYPTPGPTTPAPEPTHPAGDAT